MLNLFGFMKRLHKNEEGATAIEYGLLAALIAVVLIVTITALGGELNEVFAQVETELNAAETAAAAGDTPEAD